MLPPYISILITFLSVCLSLSLFLSLSLCCLYLLHYLQFPHRPLLFHSPNLLNVLSAAWMPSISLVGVLWLWKRINQLCSWSPLHHQNWDLKWASGWRWQVNRTFAEEKYIHRPDRPSALCWVPHRSTKVTIPVTDFFQICFNLLFGPYHISLTSKSLTCYTPRAVKTQLVFHKNLY